MLAGWYLAEEVRLKVTAQTINEIRAAHGRTKRALALAQTETTPRPQQLLVELELIEHLEETEFLIRKALARLGVDVSGNLQRKEGVASR